MPTHELAHTHKHTHAPSHMPTHAHATTHAHTATRSIAPTAHIADTKAVDALRGSPSARGKGHLPYALTGAQERALSEILDDMRRPVAMLRCVAEVAMESIGRRRLV